MFMMVMLTSVFGKQLPKHHAQNNKAPKEQNGNTKPTENQTVVSELSLEVVVPSHAFDFTHDAIILPTPQIIYLDIETKAKVFTKPIFVISYFENLYEHFIAPNAP